MTTAAMDEDAAAPGETPTRKVTCACGAVVEPTRPGGHRPRPHLDPRTSQPCRIVHSTETVCKRCGGLPRSPKPLRPGGPACSSHMFHPQTWTVQRLTRDGTSKKVQVGNAAAAGELLGLSGEYFAYIVRRYRPGSASKPPDPIGHDMGRRCRYWDLAAVRAFRDTRPGKGAGHGGATADGATVHDPGSVQ